MRNSFFVDSVRKTLPTLTKAEIDAVGGAHPGGEENHQITRETKPDGTVVITVDPKKPTDTASIAF